jgi:hypothetical protein
MALQSFVCEPRSEQLGQLVVFPDLSPSAFNSGGNFGCLAQCGNRLVAPLEWVHKLLP